MKRFVLGVTRYDSPMLYPNKNGDFVEFEEVNKVLKSIYGFLRVVYPVPGTESAEAVKAVKTILEEEIEE